MMFVNNRFRASSCSGRTVSSINLDVQSWLWIFMQSFGNIFHPIHLIQQWLHRFEIQTNLATYCPIPTDRTLAILENPRNLTTGELHMSLLAVTKAASWNVGRIIEGTKVQEGESCYNLLRYTITKIPTSTNHVICRHTHPLNHTMWRTSHPLIKHIHSYTKHPVLWQIVLYVFFASRNYWMVSKRQDFQPPESWLALYIIIVIWSTKSVGPPIPAN